MIETEKSPGWDTGAKNCSKHISQDCIEEQFREFVRQKVGVDPGQIIADGKVHRFGPNNAYAYCLHLDGVPTGWVQDWRQGATRHQWKANGLKFNTEDRKRRDDEIKAAKAERETDKAELHKKAASEAERKWDAAEPASPEHGYLKAKAIKPNGIRQIGDELVIKVTWGDKTTGLQRIFLKDGKWEKRFSAGTQKGYFLIGEMAATGGTLLICEGFATGATLHEATDHPVIVAFDAGNLLPVAKSFEGFLGDVIICPDDDWKRVNQAGEPENIGLLKGRKAALAIGARLAVPIFGKHRGEKDTDFNDLARSARSGPEAVRWCIEQADFVQRSAVDNDNQGEEAKADEKAASAAGWRDPKPIDAPLYPVQAFDADRLLPEAFRDFVADIAHRQCCPVDYAAIALIVSLGTVIGTQCGIKPKWLDDWCVIANLWGGVVGDPSQKKTPPLKEVMRALKVLVERAEKDHAKAKGKAKVEKFVADARRAKIEGDLKRAAISEEEDSEGDLEAAKEKLQAMLDADECVSAWNKDPVSGVIGVQTRPH
jgi:putative DNA primase/helicase